MNQTSSTNQEHVEYTWAIPSIDWHHQMEQPRRDYIEPYKRLQGIRESLVQLIFQSIRNVDLEKRWKVWVYCVCQIEKKSMIKFLAYGFATCAWIRDMSHGKGERDLAYKQLWSFYEALEPIYPNQAHHMVNMMIHRWCVSDEYDHPYGSWRDVKEFCNVVYHHTQNRRHPLIVDLLSWMIESLSWNKHTLTKIKWFPREHTSKVYDTFVEEWYRHYGYELVPNRPIRDLRVISSGQKAYCRRRVRKDIQQIKKSQDDSIEPMKQYAFRNIITPKLLDIHSKRIYPGQLIHRIRMWIEYPYASMKWITFSHTRFSTIIHTLWNEMIDTYDMNQELVSKVPWVDVSHHISDEQLDHSIGLALYLAHFSGKIVFVGDKHRVLTMEQQPSNLIERVRCIFDTIRAIRGTHFNIYEAISNEYTGYIPEIDSSSRPSIVILSAFQCMMDEEVLSTMDTLYNNLIQLTDTRQEFIFWNMAPSQGFPALSCSSKCSMLSGYSPNELNIPSIVWGVRRTRVNTPYSHLLMRLNSYRYNCFINFVHTCFSTL